LKNCLRVRIDLSVLRINLIAVLLLTPLVLAGLRLAAQSPWSPVGPAGGDARAFAAVPGQPSHLYLGSTNSWIYESTDGGNSWTRLSRLDAADDLVLDNILVDPANPAVVYVAAWEFGQTGGGLWISHDGGRSWKENDGLHGQSVRALAMAPSNPKILIAGTLEGIFRSSDSGAAWTQISPPGSHEIHEVESIAIDPADPTVIYAGTWHLPWKTTDGGANWHNIKQGLIEDSDVFSIIIDPVRPSVVFLSACSGIYKSEDGGEQFHKIQGIPSSARRTRVLMQDPVNRDVVYAGTTEGLYKTIDGGKTFDRMTGPDVIVNDVFVDPKDTRHVLLATDRSGVLLSQDASVSFEQRNAGFSARQVEALLVDSRSPTRLYAGVVNDKTYGGVFVSSNGGADWEHISQGLDGRDVFSLSEAQDGTVLAGTSHGIFALAPGAGNVSESSWSPKNTIQNTLIKKSTVMRRGKKINVEKAVPQKAVELDGRVYALDISGDSWLASTTSGLLTSKDHGATWQGGPVLGASQYITAAAHGSTMAAAQRDGLVVSSDAGATWMPAVLPTQITTIHRIAFSPDGALWMATREGVYFTRDDGKSWQWFERLPFRDVTDLYFDARQGRVLVSSRQSEMVYSIDPAKMDWNWTKTGWKISLIRSAGGRMLAASLDDGVLVAPGPTGTETSRK
jgi:photosystem II stability/assembly factor-like uncharacterized protein